MYLRSVDLDGGRHSLISAQFAKVTPELRFDQRQWRFVDFHYEKSNLRNFAFASQP